MGRRVRKGAPLSSRPGPAGLALPSCPLEGSQLKPSAGLLGSLRPSWLPRSSFSPLRGFDFYHGLTPPPSLPKKQWLPSVLFSANGAGDRLYNRVRLDPERRLQKEISSSFDTGGAEKSRPPRFCGPAH